MNAVTAYVAQPRLTPDPALARNAQRSATTETQDPSAKGRANAAPAEKSGDSVRISQEARQLFEAENRSRSDGSARMAGMTSQGTQVVVEATPLNESASFRMGGDKAAGLRNYSATVGANDDRLAWKNGPKANEMLFTATFTKADGSIQTFELGGNSVFIEDPDGSIRMDTVQGPGSTVLNAGSEAPGPDGQPPAGRIYIALEDGTEVNAGSGDDLIFNMARDARLHAGDGNNSIVSLADGTSITSGLGDDLIALLEDSLRPADASGPAPGSQPDVRPGGTQTIDLNAGDGNDLLIAQTDLFKGELNMGDGDDVLRMRDATSTRIDLGAGNDAARADNLYFSRLLGGDGDDQLEVTSALASRILGGDGNDTITAGTLLDSRIDGGAGDDTINVNLANNSAIGGGAGNDTIIVRQLIKSGVHGGGGDDKIFVTNSVDSVIDGGSGNNIIQVNNARNSRILNDGPEASRPVTIQDGTGKRHEANTDDIVAVGPGGQTRVLSSR